MTNNKEQSTLSIYNRETKKIPLLTFEEEQELGKRIKENNCQISRNKMIEANLRLVLSIAFKYPSNIDIMDLIAQGNMGLMKAVDMFDYTKGFRFTTYATWWIRQFISRYIVQQSHDIRVPQHRYDTYMKYKRSTRDLTHDLQRPPSFEEIAQHSGLTIKQVRYIHAHYPEMIYVDEAFDTNDDNNGELHHQEKILVSHTSDNNDNVLQVDMILKKAETEGYLSKKELSVIKGRFLDQLTLQQVGEEFGYTRERVRQIENNALRKLRSMYAK